MNNRELIEELETGWVLSEDQTDLVKINYDTIPVDKVFAVLLKTGKYTILQKSDTFDDEVLESTESIEKTIEYLKGNKD